jgi:hypothetical protein
MTSGNFLKHADLNFDGFEDVQLLQYFHPHLATSVFCIYLWDHSAGRFRYAPEIPAINPLPHPENKTITVHQDLFGGVFSDSTYRWEAPSSNSLKRMEGSPAARTQSAALQTTAAD